MYPHYPFPAPSSTLLVLVSLCTPARVPPQQQQQRRQLAHHNHHHKKSFHHHVRGRHGQDGPSVSGMPPRQALPSPGSGPVALRNRPVRAIGPADIPRAGRALAELRRNDARDARSSTPKRPGPRLVVLCLHETYGPDGKGQQRQPRRPRGPGGKEA